MNDIEKTIKVLTSFDRTNDIMLRNAVEIAVPILEKELKNNWHSFDKELPENDIQVLIKLSNGKIITGGRLNDSWYLGSMDIMWLYFDDVIFMNENIKMSFWKPLLVDLED